MIVETQAVGPFMKNGFVVACEETREACSSIRATKSRSSGVVRRQRLTVRHILLTHAHVDHVTGVARPKRALGVPVLSAPRRSVPVRPRSRVRRDVRPARRAAAADRRFYEPGQVIPFGRYEVRARTIRRVIAPAVSVCRSAKVERRERTCSSATRSSPDRSAGRTCRAATTPRSSRRSARCFSPSATTRASIRGTGRTRRSDTNGERIPS